MDFAERNRLIQVQEEIEVRNLQGGINPEWRSYATIWANVQPRTGREILRADIQGEISHVVRIRRLKGLRPNHRILFEDNRILNIVSVIQIDEGSWEMEILAREIK